MSPALAGGFFTTEPPGKLANFNWFQCMKVKSESEVAQPYLIPRPHGLQPTRLLCRWDFPGKNTRVGCHCLLHKSHWPSNSDHWGFPVPLPDPQAGKPDVGPRTFTTVEELLWYYGCPDHYLAEGSFSDIWGSLCAALPSSLFCLRTSPQTLSSIFSTQRVLQALSGFPFPAPSLGNTLKT